MWVFNLNYSFNKINNCNLLFTFFNSQIGDRVECTNIVIMTMITSNKFRTQTDNLKFWTENFGVYRKLSKLKYAYILRLKRNYAAFKRRRSPTTTGAQFRGRPDTAKLSSMVCRNFAILCYMWNYMQRSWLNKIDLFSWIQVKQLVLGAR